MEKDRPPETSACDPGGLTLRQLHGLDVLEIQIRGGVVGLEADHTRNQPCLATGIVPGGRGSSQSLVWMPLTQTARCRPWVTTVL